MSDETKAANQLILQPNIHDADGFYDELLQVHEGLSKDQSDALNARLILVLCNHIGDRVIIREALGVAAQSESETNSDSDLDTASTPT